MQSFFGKKRKDYCLTTMFLPSFVMTLTVSIKMSEMGLNTSMSRHISIVSYCWGVRWASTFWQVGLYKTWIVTWDGKIEDAHLADYLLNSLMHYYPGQWCWIKWWNRYSVDQFDAIPFLADCWPTSSSSSRLLASMYATTTTTLLLNEQRTTKREEASNSLALWQRRLPKCQ